MPSPLENLEKLIGTPRDGALLRYSLGLEYAKAAYRDGIAAAEARGDLQAVKEMRVFLKRLERS